MNCQPKDMTGQSRVAAVPRGPRDATVLLLCGGLATRMWPIASGDSPKSMVPFLGRPLIDYLLDLFAENGFCDIVLTSAHNSFVSHLSQGRYTALHIRYQQPTGAWRGTANCVRDVVNALGSSVSDPYLVVYGDSLLRADLDRMLAFHHEHGADATILFHCPDLRAFLYEPLDQSMRDCPRTNYGVMECDANQHVTHFLEKPILDDIPRQFLRPCANAAVYVMRRSALEEYGTPDVADFAYDLFPRMIREGKRMLGFPVGKGYREDVGTLERYHRLQMEVLDGRLEIPTMRLHGGTRIWIGDGAVVSSGAILVPPVFVGARSIIEPHARIERSCLADDVHVEQRVAIASSVIHSGVRLREGSRIARSVIGAHSEIGRELDIPAGTVVGSYSRFGHPGL